MRKYLVSTTILAVAAAILASCTVTENVDEQPDLVPAVQERPNVLIILADDLGFSDLGAFGGEIETPNLDALAMDGLRFTSFYTAQSCAPTRAMLLTGQDTHNVGLGVMDHMRPMLPEVHNTPGYEGYLDPAATTIAEAISDAGYLTAMSGKWHLGVEPGWLPSDQGFEESFILVQGAHNHFGDQQGDAPSILSGAKYWENGKKARYPVGEYSSDVFTTRLIDQLEVNSDDGRPFFAYLAFSAPHWPLQAPADLIAKYEGRYDAGPAALRAERLARMKTLELLDDRIMAAELAELDDWNALTPEQRAIEARNMEIYAAMVDSLDQNVGRVIDYLRATGKLDNTIIFFMSDNGAEGVMQPSLERMAGRIGSSELLALAQAANVDVEKMGNTDSFLTYGPQWAQAAMAPFRNYKGSLFEGGVKSPAFVAGPGIEGGGISDATLSVRDIMPTVLELAGTTYTDKIGSNTAIGDVNVPTARSLMPLINASSEAVRGEEEPLAWELHYARGVRLGDWKAVYGPPEGMSSAPGDTTGWSWRLFNLRTDPDESTDLKEQNPEDFQRMLDVWDAYVEANGVFIPEQAPPKE